MLAEEYPLVFNSGARPHTDFRSQHHGIEGLLADNPEPTVEIHSEDAARREIETGDLVDVATVRGAVPLRARVTDDMAKGAIECNMGGGTPVGPKPWREWNINELTDLANCDEISGFPVYKALLCDVRRLDRANEAARSSASYSAKNAKNKRKVCDPLPSRLTRRQKTKPAERVYLDNNATTPLADAVREAMLPFLAGTHGNPSSIHTLGRDARQAVEKARRQVARLVNARPRRIIFTGGGSEADNLTLKGVALAPRGNGSRIITSRAEHPAVLNTCRFLERLGFEITYLDVDSDGRLSPESLRRAVTKDSTLVSLMMANNEVGTIQPVKELAAIAREAQALFHTDAIQAVGKIKVDVEELGVDMLSISAHKFQGPKGIGALYVRAGIKLEPLVHGGEQEASLRAGTENVPAIVGFGQAAELALQAPGRSKKTKALRNKLEKGIKELIPNATLNGHREYRLPNTLNLTLPEFRGESLVMALDQQGISLSSGSACKSGSPEPTHVLMAMGRTAREAHCTVRLSLSTHTSEKDIDVTVSALAQILKEKETTVRFLPCK